MVSPFSNSFIVPNTHSYRYEKKHNVSKHTSVAHNPFIDGNYAQQSSTNKRVRLFLSFIIEIYSDYLVNAITRYCLHTEPSK